MPRSNNACIKKKCSHLCLLNGPSNYTCGCPVEMELSSDGVTCKTNKLPELLLIGSGQQLMTFDHNSFGKQNHGSTSKYKMYIDDMAYNSLTGEIFIADNTDKQILLVNYSSEATKTLTSNSIKKISSMSFGKYNTMPVSLNISNSKFNFLTDYLANNLFWSDSELATIEVFSLNTLEKATLLKFPANDKPIAIALISDIG